LFLFLFKYRKKGNNIIFVVFFVAKQQQKKWRERAYFQAFMSCLVLLLQAPMSCFA
jgi:hypothetical protein